MLRREPSKASISSCIGRHSDCRKGVGVRRAILQYLGGSVGSGVGQPSGTFFSYLRNLSIVSLGEERGQTSNSGDAQGSQRAAIPSPSEEWRRISHNERSAAGEPLPNPGPFWMTSRSILPKVTLWLNFFSCLDHRWVARRRRGG